MSSVVGWGNTDSEIIQNLVKEVSSLKTKVETLEQGNDFLIKNDVALKQMIDEMVRKQKGPVYYG